LASAEEVPMTNYFISGGIGSEDFDIIPPNQNLYACDYDANEIVKLSANYPRGSWHDLFSPTCCRK
jgi:hypothetical protein